MGVVGSWVMYIDGQWVRGWCEIGGNSLCSDELPLRACMATASLLRALHMYVHMSN